MPKNAPYLIVAIVAFALGFGCGFGVRPYLAETTIAANEAPPVKQIDPATEGGMPVPPPTTPPAVNEGAETEAPVVDPVGDGTASPADNGEATVPPMGPPNDPGASSVPSPNDEVSGPPMER